MSDIPKVKYTDLAVLARNTITASHAVTMGIATHAEKEHAERGRKLTQLEAQARMTEHKVVNVTQL